MKIEVLKSAMIKLQSSFKCEHSIHPQVWNKMRTVCEKTSSLKLNGKNYCRAHAGKTLVDYHIEQSLTKE